MIYGKKFMNKKSLKFASVLSITLASIATISSASAANSSNWSGRPSWASQSGSSTRKSPTYLEKIEAESQVPFAPGSNNLSLDVGQFFLVGDLSKYTDNIGAQLHYTYGVSEVFGFDSSFGYSSHSDGQFTMTTLLTGLRTNLSWYDKAIPYATVGMGFYRPSYELPAGGSLSPVLFGIHLGGGVDLQVSRNIFFGTGLNLHNIFTSTKKFTTLDGKEERREFGGSYAAFLLHGGVTF
jgi:opacity protein-like surface antigen